MIVNLSAIIKDRNAPDPHGIRRYFSDVNDKLSSTLVFSLWDPSSCVAQDLFEEGLHNGRVAAQEAPSEQSFPKRLRPGAANEAVLGLFSDCTREALLRVVIDEDGPTLYLQSGERKIPVRSPQNFAWALLIVLGYPWVLRGNDQAFRVPKVSEGDQLRMTMLWYQGIKNPSVCACSKHRGFVRQYSTVHGLRCVDCGDVIEIRRVLWANAKRTIVRDKTGKEIRRTNKNGLVLGLWGEA